jgi:hypothetical protein
MSVGKWRVGDAKKNPLHHLTFAIIVGHSISKVASSSDMIVERASDSNTYPEKGS